MTDPHLQLRNLTVHRGGRLVLDIPQLAFARGQVTVLLGPNGSGKSTLLGVLQLVLHPTSGDLTLDGAAMQADPVRIRRRMAAAFQEPLLLSMPVRQNVELPLRLRGVRRARRRESARHWLERFGILALADRHARQLSGGEAQRVSLARAFASQPEVLLLDEPFAGVDAPTRDALISDFAAILAETRPTTILVTHDRDEALRLGDRAALLIDGQVRQTGPPLEIFDHPADRDVAQFVGVDNIFPMEDYPFATDAPAGALLCIRPEQIQLERGADALITRAELAGPMVRVTLAAGSVELIAQIARPQWQALALEVGRTAAVCIPPDAVHLIPAERSADA